MADKRIKDLTAITAFRTGDVIPVDGPSGTAKMTKDNLLKETAQNAQDSVHNLQETSSFSYDDGLLVNGSGNGSRFFKLGKIFSSIASWVSSLILNIGFASFEKSSAILNWSQGSITADGDNGDASNRVRTDSYYEASSSSVGVSFNSSIYKMRYFEYDENKDFVTWAERTADFTISTTTGHFIRFCALRKNDANFTPLDATDLKLIVTNLNGTDFIYDKPQYKTDVLSIIDSVLDSEFRLLEINDAITIWEQGTIDSSGTESDANNRIRTPKYYEATAASVGVSFNSSIYKMRYFEYDENKDFVTWNERFADFTISTTTGHFIRFCALRKNDANFTPADAINLNCIVSGLSTSEFIYKKPIYNASSKLNGKKVAFIGDSITAGAGSSGGGDYVNQISAITGCTSVNLGVNGTCIANNTKNGLGSSRFVTRATSANLGDADLVVVFGGTNDLSYDSKAIGDHFAETTITASGNIGTKQLGPTADTDTFAGALHDLITTIQGVVAQGTPILFVTPLHRNNNSASNPNSYQCNSNGDFMIDFVNAIKDICGFYAVPVLDLYADGEINPLVANYSYLFSDGLHPNNAGHKVIAERIVDFVENNISFIS